MRTPSIALVIASLTVAQLGPAVAAAQLPPPDRSWGGAGGGWDGGWQGGNGQVVRCESWNYRYARCHLDAGGNRVQLVRRIAGDCREGRNWGYSSRGRYVWVDRGCRAEFQAGGWQNDRDRGPSAGAVIAGVAVAAGLIALLASKGKKAEDKPAEPGATVTPAAINIAPGAVPAAAEPGFRHCLDEAARQIGATGGTAIRLLGKVDSAPDNGGWRFRIPLEARWPQDTHPTPATCRATSDKLVALEFEPS